MPLSQCARSCCWVPMPGVCGKKRACRCHWDEINGYAPTITGGALATHADPTSREAIYNIEKARRGK